jgi:di/tricarboxylate transporter
MSYDIILANILSFIGVAFCSSNEFTLPTNASAIALIYGTGHILSQCIGMP